MATGAFIDDTITYPSSARRVATNPTVNMTDKGGTPHSVSLTIYPEGSGNGDGFTDGVTEIAAVDGNIKDLDETRILHSVGADVYLRDRKTGAETKTGMPSGGSCKLFDGGAICGNQIYRGGAVVDLEASGLSVSFVAGAYAALLTSTGGASNYLRDLKTGTNSYVASGAAFDNIALAANGDLCYCRFPSELPGAIEPHIYQYRAGAIIDIGSARCCPSGIADEVNQYIVLPNIGGSQSPYIRTSAGKVCPWTSSTCPSAMLYADLPSPVLLTGGWVAYGWPDAGKIRQA